MLKCSRKELDFNEMARKIVAPATSEPASITRWVAAKPEAEKDPAAVALGRKGGLKGGKARAEKMTAAGHSASAKRLRLRDGSLASGSFYRDSLSPIISRSRVCGLNAFKFHLAAK